MMMAPPHHGRNKVIMDDSVNPIYRVMIHSYTRKPQHELIETTNAEGVANRDAILAADLERHKLPPVMVQNPNFFGASTTSPTWPTPPSKKAIC
jgi:glycine dehydrogenase subunit 1